MLILSRKKGQRVVIGGRIVLTIADIRGDRVSLAFEAPPEVTIHREEIHQRLAQDGASGLPVAGGPLASSGEELSPGDAPRGQTPAATDPHRPTAPSPDESFYCPECA